MYTVTETSKKLSVRVEDIYALIKQGVVSPASKRLDGRKYKVYALTGADVETIERHIAESRSMSAPWTVSVSPQYLKSLVHADRDVVHAQCEIWKDFLNGHWTEKKPRCAGVYLVESRIDGIPKYRAFTSMTQIENWAGLFWSERVPIPFTIGRSE